MAHQRRTAVITGILFVGLAVAILLWSTDSSGRWRYRHPVRPLTGSIGETAEAMKKRLAKAPSPLDLIDLASLALDDAKRNDDAAALLRAKALLAEADAKLPGLPGAKLVGASIADLTHHFDEALALAKAGFDATGSLGAASIIATASLARGDVDEALRWSDLLVRRRPMSASYFVRALALAARGRDEEAVFDFDRVVALESAAEPLESARMRAIWGRLRWHQGFRREARALAKDALRIAPQSVPALALHGEISLEDDPERAVADYREAFRLSRRPRFLALSARALERLGRFPDAERARGEAEKLLRKDIARETGHRMELVETLLDRRDRVAAEEARALIREEMTMRRSPEVFSALARAEELSGNVDAALGAAQAALSGGFPDVFVYAHLARLERLGGNPLRAAMYGQKAGSAEPPPLARPAAGAR